MSIQKYLQSELHKITREINQYGENYVFGVMMSISMENQQAPPAISRM